jgi:hypothetical protein
MPINLQGVELLKADLRANAANYQQSTFGRIAECGTMQCMAGFCRLREVGKEAYTREVIRDDVFDLQVLCVSSGAGQLGIDCAPEDCPPIFDSYTEWPFDLREAYREARTDIARAEAACAALDRLNDDGSIKPLEEV